ncbi:MAG: UDP-2,3-diacylglucosamine diphosphatase [Thiohalomonadales bacterium]
MKHINNFDNAAIAEASKHQVHGIICGHIHNAGINKFNNFRYCNDGDWVESCTALVEHHDGTLEIINWADMYDRTQTSYSESDPNITNTSVNFQSTN